MPFTLVVGNKGGGSTPPLDPPSFPLPRQTAAHATPPTVAQVAELVRVVAFRVNEAPETFDVFNAVVDATRNNTTDARSLADLFTGHWQGDRGLVNVLKHWAALRASDRLQVGQLAYALTERNAHLLEETMEHFGRTFGREQCAELAGKLQRVALGAVYKVDPDDDDSRAGRTRAVLDTFDTLTEQQQTDLAAVIVALAQRNVGKETRNTAATVRANVLRFIRHVFGTDDYADDLLKIAKTCIDFIAGKGRTKHEKEGGE